MIPILFISLVVSAWCKPLDYYDPMINEGLLEGDIMGIDPHIDRNAVPKDSQRWPGGVIPYVIDESLNPDKKLVMEAMKHIEDRSCIRFKPRTDEKDYLRLTKAYKGCWSFWGRLGIGEQLLSLGYGCENKGIYVHELMHAIGFEHEHIRSDRDDYLIIHCENVKEAGFHNPMINDGLFEGDIMGIDPDIDRNAVPRDSQRWIGGIVPYEIDESLHPLWFKIADAMMHIQEKSCIRFVQRTNEKDYVRMYKGTGCWSYWGRQGNGKQDISLGVGCDPFASIVHELLHAIGFEHEHNRSDRDDHLIINWENIEEKWQYAFRKLRPEENRLLTPFDFDSLMLYGQHSFSKHPNLKSMEARNGRFMEEPYNKPGMSASDVTRLKMLYNCSE